MQTKGEPVQINNKITEFTNNIKQLFTYEEGYSFDLYPFSNELGWPEIIKHLKQISCSSSETINVSLLFGESNFLSLLPWLSSSIVLLADINPPLHKFTTFLINCFQKSESPKEFLDYYLSESSGLNLVNFENEKHFTKQDFEEMIKIKMDDLGKYHFLANQKSFDLCKSYFKKIIFLHIYLDLKDYSKCVMLNTILTNFGAKLVFTNITNIHHYANESELKGSMNYLVQNKQSPLIIYSEKIGDYAEYRAVFVNQVNDLYNHRSTYQYNDYLKIISTFPGVIAHFISSNPDFSIINKEKKPKNPSELSYIGYAVNERSIKDFLVNKEELHAHPLWFNLRAHNTIQEARESTIKDIEERNKKCIDSDDKKRLDDYWIITFRGKKEKINQRIRFFDNKFVSDQYAARSQIFSRAISAANPDNTIVIEKEEAMNTPKN